MRTNNSLAARALLGLLLFTAAALAFAQEIPAEDAKLQREIAKLDLEIAALEQPSKLARDLPPWMSVLLGFLGGTATTLATVWGARRTRLGELDQAVHERRLASYPRLVACGARLAVYFPRHEANGARLSPVECAEMGRAMCRWYFGGGGLLLSAGARDAYFELARALTLASLAKSLDVPTFPDDAAKVSIKLLDRYRDNITVKVLDDIENWKFGGDVLVGPEGNPFRDYVFLQRLASGLRTALATDIRGRLRPA